MNSTGLRTLAVRRPYRLAVIIAVAGAVLSVLGAWARWRAERTTREAEFQAEAQSVAASFQRNVDDFFEILQSIGRLHDLSDKISEADFREFLDKGMAYQARALGAYGFTQNLTTLGTNGNTLVLNQRFPLVYQYPESGLGVPLGHDFAANPLNAAAIRWMLTTGRPILGEPVFATPDRPEGYQAMAPIFSTNFQGQSFPAPGYLVGFTVAVLRPGEMRDRAIPQHLAPRMATTLLFPATLETTEPSRVFLWTDRTVTLGAQPGVLRFEAAPGWAAKRPGALPVLILLGGLLVTSLLCRQLVWLARRTREIEDTVAARTAELRETNIHLGDEMAARKRLESQLVEISSREKERLGRDLHDSLGQQLAGAVFLSRALTSTLAGAPANQREAAERINAILKDAVAQTRRLARGLAPVDVGEDALADALRRLAEDTAAVYNIRCVFTAEGECRAPDEASALHLYHLAQEAVNNAVRHGKATEIAIRWETTDGRALRIEDNGAGLPPGAERSGGMGLMIMRHRSEMIGGALDFAPRPGGGTTVTCRLPS